MPRSGPRLARPHLTVYARDGPRAVFNRGATSVVENLAAAVALHFMYYNLARVHMRLKRTPAVAADYDIHLYFKRAKHLEPLYGSAEEHRELSLQAILTPSADRVAASV